MTDAKQTVETSPARRVNWVVFALLGGVVLLIGLLWFFSSNRNPAQDRLADNQVAAAAPDPEKRCAAQATYDLIKRELFRRAAQLRGSDQAAYDHHRAAVRDALGQAAFQAIWEQGRALTLDQILWHMMWDERW